MAVGLTLGGVNLSTFSAASVAAGIATSGGVSPAAVKVTVVDLTVSGSLKLTGVNSLTPAQMAAVQAEVALRTGNRPNLLVKMGASATVAGRRLLDLSLPVTVTGHGSNTMAAANSQIQLQNALNLAAFAFAGGAANATLDSTPAVNAILDVEVTAPSYAMVSSLQTMLASATALQAALQTAGVSATVEVTTQPSTLTISAAARDASTLLAAFGVLAAAVAVLL